MEITAAGGGFAGMAMKEADAEVFSAMLDTAADMCVGEMLQAKWHGPRHVLPAVR